MKALSTSSLNPFVRLGYALLLAAFAAGMTTLPFSIRAAVLPAAVIFGWSQIGGL